MTSPDDTFSAYAVGPVYVSVCTSLSDDDARARLNAEHPAGGGTVWDIAPHGFRTGEANGHPCERKPATHRHILFN